MLKVKSGTAYGYDNGNGLTAEDAEGAENGKRLELV